MGGDPPYPPLKADQRWGRPPNPRPSRSELAVHPGHEGAPVDRLGRAALLVAGHGPVAVVLAELGELVAEPEEPHLLVEVGLLELVGEEEQDRVGALVGES